MKETPPPVDDKSVPPIDDQLKGMNAATASLVQLARMNPDAALCITLKGDSVASSISSDPEKALLLLHLLEKQVKESIDRKYRFLDKRPMAQGGSPIAGLKTLASPMVTKKNQ